MKSQAVKICFLPAPKHRASWLVFYGFTDLKASKKDPKWGKTDMIYQSMDKLRGSIKMRKNAGWPTPSAASTDKLKMK